MTPNEYSRQDAVGLAALVRAGEVSAEEVARAALDAIAALNPTLNAVVLVDEARTIAQARAVDRQAPLAGVPLLVKDNNVFVEGWPTTFSSAFFVGAPTRADSTLVARLRAAGVVFAGKSNTPEFAADWTTEPTLRGPTRNPWNLAHSPGGSSGGSAAAVASRMVPAAHGNDNAGSIRVPAAVCGLFGLKPSRGLVPVGPYFSELAAGHNCEHVLTRSVRDSAALLDAMAGPEAGARYPVPRSVPSYLAALEQAPSRLRIGVVEKAPAGVPVDEEIAAALQRVAELFAARGDHVETIAMPNPPTLGADAEKMWFADVALAMRERAAELGRTVRRDEMEAITAYALERIAAIDVVEYVAARERLYQVVLGLHRELAGYDLLLTPTTCEPAPPLGEFDTRTERFDADLNAERSARFAPFTELFNITGQPAASCAAGLTSGGLPIGIQLAGRQGEDHLVLQAAAMLEQAMPPVGPPPVAIG